MKTIREMLREAVDELQPTIESFVERQINDSIRQFVDGKVAEYDYEEAVNDYLDNSYDIDNYVDENIHEWVEETIDGLEY